MARISSRVGILFVFAFTALAALVLEAASLDQVSVDEAALAKHIQMLESSALAVREAAAASIRTIVAKYPSGTVNIREADGGAARWQRKLEEVKSGMSEADALLILAPLAVWSGSSSGRRGGSMTTNYQLDEHWSCSIMYRTDDSKTRIVVRAWNLGVRDRIVLPKPPPAFSGSWPVWYSNGVPIPGATARDGMVAIP
jgi:hypothetical protein